MFIRLDAAAFIKFFVIRVRPVFEGGFYLKSNLFLANNIMATEHLNLKKKTYFSACLKSHFLYRSQLIALRIKRKIISSRDRHHKTVPHS